MQEILSFWIEKADKVGIFVESHDPGRGKNASERELTPPKLKHIWDDDYSFRRRSPFSEKDMDENIERVRSQEFQVHIWGHYYSGINGEACSCFDPQEPFGG
ncbi:MAG: hypothetical protein F4X62_12415 [Caldilineaceae bacterium SB0662_bin_25]|nr:hypothetical protein [Caldilineaceae bacterium SB0662_bin_25]